MTEWPLPRLLLRLRQLLPLGLSLLAVLLTAAPTRLPGFAAIMPVLPLICVYYWAIFRPDLMSPATAFLLGLAADLVGGTPLGVSSLVFVAVQGTCASQRRFFLGKPFTVAWWGFVPVATGAQAMQWLFASLLAGRILPVDDVFYQALATCAAYPLASWLFARAWVLGMRGA